MSLDAALLTDPTAPWCMALATHYGWQTRGRYDTYQQACAAGVALRKQLNLEVGAVSISHVDDGAELWPLECGINKLVELHRIELGKVRPDPMRVQRIEEQMARLYTEAYLLAYRYDKTLTQTKRGDLWRLEFAEPSTVRIEPWQSAS